MRRFWISLSIILTIITSLVIYKYFFANDNNLQITKAKIGDVVQKVTVAGQIVPNKRMLLIPPYTGYVKKLYVKIGDNIKANDPIVLFVQSLRESDTAYPLRAPFAGTVVQTPKLEGEYADTTKESVLVRIDDLTKLFIQCDVAEGDVLKLKKDLEVIVKVNGVFNKTYKGIVREISEAAVDKQNWGGGSDKVNFTVRMEITDKDESIKPGMSAIVDIITDKKVKVLTLPLEYISKKNSKYYVTTQKGLKKEVKIGLENEELFEILSGVIENEPIKMVDFLSESDTKNL